MNDRNPLTQVSAVISAWNRREDLRENLVALYDQTHPLAEIIVVDNHSTDGSVEMVKDEYSEVNLIEMPDSSKGACETFNIGFKAARNELVLILDFSLPPHPVVRAVYGFYFHRVLPFLGGLVSGNFAAYKYLPESVADFPPREEFAASMGAAGLDRVSVRDLTLGEVSVRDLTLGVASLYEGTRP